MKIIQTDNFNKDESSESVIAENVFEYFAKPICDFLNEKYSGNNSPYFYVVKPDDYKQYVWEP